MEKRKVSHQTYFLAGVLSASFVLCGMAGAAIILKLARIGNEKSGPQGQRIDIPPDVLEELNLGSVYGDWSELVDRYRQEAKSVFAPFALYVDHVHVSAAGNRLMAEKISSLLPRRN